MKALFSSPDLYIARCGRLDCAVVERPVPAPPFLKGLKALLACDLHALPRTTDADMRSLAEKIAGLKPDLLLLGGDYADRREDAVRLFSALAAVKPRLGGYGVAGNNDAEAWDGMDGLRGVMAKAGFGLLVNESARIAVGGGTLYIGGVDEHKHGAPRSKGLYPDRPAPDTYRVLLSHYPCLPDSMPDLMLSGHTHGGQFNALGLTPFSIGFERLFRRDIRSLAVSGVHDIGGMKLLVSKGVGASRLQLRAGVRPEIDLIRFV